MRQFFNRLKIREKLIVTFLPMPLLSIVIIGSLWYWNALNAVRESVEQQTSALAQNASLLVEKYLEERKLEVNSIAQLTWVEEFFARRNASSQARYQDRLKRLLASLDGVYSQVTAFDKDLNPFAKVQLTSFATDDQLPIHFEDRMFNRLDSLDLQNDTVLQTGQVAISDVKSIRGSQALVLTAMIEAPRTSSQLGFLAFVFPVSGIAERVIKNYNIGFAGQTFIVARSGQLVYHTAKAKINQTLQAAMPYLAKNREQILNSLEKSFRYRDDQDASWVLSIAPARNAGWVIGVASPLKPFLQSTQRAGLFGILLTLGISVVLLVLIHILSNPMVRNIAEVTVAANAVAQGELDLKVPVRSQDEIGELASDFNKMAQDLKRLIREVDIHKNLAAIGKFAAAMYHDVKSPLEGLKLLANGLQRKLETEDSRRPYVDEIVLGIANLDRLIHETLDFVKPKTLALSETNLNEFLQSVVSEATSDGVKLEWKLAKKLPAIQLDPKQLNHAVANIAVNAKEAMPDGGNLLIATSLVNDSAVIEFTDIGCGIAGEKLDAIFQPFYSTKQAGHGLGLAIAHQIVKNHAGDIEIESQVGKGTKVTVRLPLTQGTGTPAI